MGHREERACTGWEERYYKDKHSESADQVEFNAIKNETSSFSEASSSEFIAGVNDEYISSDLLSDRLQGNEIVREAIEGSVAEIINERKRLLGDLYPFKLEGNSLQYSPIEGALRIYEFLLWICQAPSLSEKPYNELPKLFEKISVLAGMSYIGQTSCGFVTGWPRPRKISRFKDLINKLKEISGSHESEWDWRPQSHLPSDPNPTHIKDGKLDVVICNNWPDGRTGRLYYFGQCACGENWLDKTNELCLDTLSEWFSLPRVKPVRCFFTPRYANKSLLNEISFKGGLVFDRIRIVKALSEPHIKKSKTLFRKIDKSLSKAYI